MLQCVAVCCSVLQRVAACCSVLQCVTVCCSVLQCVAVCFSMLYVSCRVEGLGFTSKDDLFLHSIVNKSLGSIVTHSLYPCIYVTRRFCHG